jgi:uncharacterized protein
MSVIDLTDHQPKLPDGADVGPSRTTAVRRCELVWDLPNQSAHLTELLGAMPTKSRRPDFEALAALTRRRAGDADAVAATVFVNVPANAQGLQGFLTALRNLGFGVFARPKVGKSDIDDDIVNHVRSISHELQDLLVGTHDRELLERCTREVPDRCRVTVLAFEEASAWAMNSQRLEFVDLEDIPGFFTTPLHRTRLRHLPPQGMLLPPMNPLAPKARCVGTAASVSTVSDVITQALDEAEVV